jgi:hypothetical protein
LRLTIASNWMSSYDSANSAQFFIGIDGGGTSCRARIEDAQGHFWVREPPGLLQRASA